MAYAVRSTKNGFEVWKDGYVWAMVSSRSADSYKGLNEAKKRADAYVKGDKSLLTAKIPNTYIYGIFKKTKKPSGYAHLY